VKKGSERKLPAVSAIAAASAVATISTTTASSTTAAATSATTTTAIATTASTAAAAVTTPSTTTAGSFCLRPRFVHHQIAAPKILSVERRHGLIRFFIVGNFDERESARLSREAIANQTDCRGVDTDLPEPFLQLLFRRVEWQIAYVKLLHLRTPFARNRTTIAERTGETLAAEVQKGCAPGKPGVQISGLVHGLEKWLFLQP